MLNHIVIMGRLVQDPVLRTTQSGVNVASFTVAVDRDFGGRDGNERQTDFIDCVAWRQTGEFDSRYFQKGRMIVVSGRLQSRKWQDREGNNRTNWEISADNVYFGDSKRDSESNNYSQSSYTAPAGYGGSNNSSSHQNTPVPQVSPNPFEELEDDGELPF